MNRRRWSALSASLPVFPWDTLADATALAKSHPDGIVDLSVGTPVDPVAPLIRDALAAASAAPGYPTTAGTPELRQSAVAALDRRYGVTGLTEAAVLPVIGTKELIAWLPTLLALSAEDLVVVPELAYPTYDVGARLAGTRVLYADSLTQLGPAGAGIGVRELAEQSDRAGARRRSSAQGRRLGPGARRAGGIRRVLPGPGLGRRAAVGTASRGVRRRPHRSAGGALAVQELLAGRLPGRLRRRRRRRGRRAAGGAQTRRDDGADTGAGGHGRRARRRRPRASSSATATAGAGMRCCRRSARPASPSTIPRPGCIYGSPAASHAATPSAWLAQRGILAAPGEFYGPRGARHVRVALTATDERIAAAVDRLG